MDGLHASKANGSQDEEMIRQRTAEIATTPPASVWRSTGWHAYSKKHDPLLPSAYPPTAILEQFSLVILS